jgi:murein DD-endopeptidase MepM/ murein hydrolase activator NlpD
MHFALYQVQQIYKSSLIRNLALLSALSLSLMLTGCGGHSSSQKLLANIENDLKKNHKIKHGAIVARYGLTHNEHSKCLYFKDYSLVINEESRNRDYIRNVSSKCKSVKLLQQRAKAKLLALQHTLANLNNKYAILSQASLKKLTTSHCQSEVNSVFDLVSLEGAQKKNHADYIESLYQIDHLTGHIPLFFPQYNSNLTSTYGMRVHPITKTKKMHCGTDFAGCKSSSVYAAADGVVIEAGSVQGYGLTLVVKHGKDLKTRYAHLQKLFVKEGASVMRGQKIALQGSSGNVTDEHLHFEVLVKDKHVDPMDFVASGYHCQKAF